VNEERVMDTLILRLTAIIRVLAMTLLAFTLLACERPVSAGEGIVRGSDEGSEMSFERVPLQFVAALGAPDASSGSGAQDWGLWPVDPGPRGVRLNNYESMRADSGMAPAGWEFDATDWWLEENGLLMESPEFPLAPGKYVVTGDREVTTVLTIYPDDANGNRRWELADDATLYDVTHLGCRSARYTSSTGGSCSPANAPLDAFRVAPGAAMPPVEGCDKQDYAVLFLIGIAKP
jgi:hypothetical protein